MALWGGAVISVVCAVIAVLIPGWGTGALLLAGALVAGWNGLWVRLVVDRGGLTVWNLRRHRIEWSELERLTLESPWWSYGQALTIWARDGRRLYVWAVSTNRGGSGRGHVQRTLSALRQVQGARGR